MVFSSVTFLMYFLPITVALYYLCGKLLKSTSIKNLILLIASIIFYAWGEPVYIILMLLSIAFNYIAGRDISACKERGNKRQARLAFIFAIVFNLAALGFFKYYGFFMNNIKALLHLNITVRELALPIGISFYTFQIMSYIIDLYKGKVSVQKNPLDFALYISLFPQLIAGPIVRYTDIEYQLRHRVESTEKFTRGFMRFTIGLAKKILFANTMGAVFDSVSALGTDKLSSVTAWIGIIAYTLQIYFDFSGYSDMAIGLGGIFGFDFCENFNYPYIAKSVTDFWRRWHISLSTWFKEYVYIPLGGNRRKTPRVILNLLIVWLLTGLWHGAAWNFEAWGLYYGIILIIEKYLLKNVIKKIPSAIMHIVTMIIVMIGWVFFSSESFGYSVEYIKAMFFGSSIGVFDSQAWFYILSYGIAIAVAAVFATPLPMKLIEKVNRQKMNIARIIIYPAILLLCIVFMISDTYNPFLYFRF